MKKILLSLLIVATMIGFAQQYRGEISQIFVNDLTGEMVQWSSPNSTSISGKIAFDDGGGGIAECRCYQGPDAYEKNKANNPQGSCCWVDPKTASYPYCSFGCI